MKSLHFMYEYIHKAGRVVGQRSSHVRVHWTCEAKYIHAGKCLTEVRVAGDPPCGFPFSQYSSVPVLKRLSPPSRASQEAEVSIVDCKPGWASARVEAAQTHRVQAQTQTDAGAS